MAAETDRPGAFIGFFHNGFARAHFERVDGATAGFPHSQWLSPGRGFMAFKFNNGSGTQYGWARPG